MCEKRRFYLVEGQPVFRKKQDRQVKLDQKRLSDYGIEVEERG